MPNNQLLTTYILNQPLKKLFNAITMNDAKKVEDIIRIYPECINTIVKPLNDSALSRILLRNPINYPMLTLLINNRVDLNVPMSMDQLTPLEFACKNRDLTLCSFLIKNKVRISSLAPHYLLCLTTNIQYLGFKEISKLYQIIEVLGGLQNVADMLDGNHQRFQDCAKKTKLINQYGGSMKYDLWSLLELAKMKVIEEKLTADNHKEIILTLSQLLLPVLSTQVFMYYIFSSIQELHEVLDAINREFRKKTQNDIKLDSSLTFFNTNSQIIADYVVPLPMDQDKKMPPNENKSNFHRPMNRLHDFDHLQRVTYKN